MPGVQDGGRRHDDSQARSFAGGGPSCPRGSWGLTAAEWYVEASVSVSGDGKTWATAFRGIQKGIDASADGDVVSVAQETYIENINFAGKTSPFVASPLSIPKL